MSVAQFFDNNADRGVILNEENQKIVDRYSTVLLDLRKNFINRVASQTYARNEGADKMASLMTDVKKTTAELIVQVRKDNALVSLLQSMSHLLGIQRWCNPIEPPTETTTPSPRADTTGLEKQIDKLDYNRRGFLKKRNSEPNTEEDRNRIAFTMLAMKHILIRLRANGSYVVVTTAQMEKERCLQVHELTTQAFDEHSNLDAFGALCQLMQMCDDLNRLSEDIREELTAHMNHRGAGETWTTTLEQFEPLYNRECWYATDEDKALLEARYKKSGSP